MKPFWLLLCKLLRRKFNLILKATYVKFKQLYVVGFNTEEIEEILVLTTVSYNQAAVVKLIDYGVHHPDSNKIKIRINKNWQVKIAKNMVQAGAAPGFSAKT